MYLFNNYKIESWQPDFSSSEQRSPLWSKLILDDKILINSLEWIDWLENPIQIIICEQCGFPKCKNGNYVDFFRLDNYLFLTLPELSFSDNEFDTEQYAASSFIKTKGSILIDKRGWELLRKENKKIPKFEEFTQITNNGILLSWLSGFSVTGISHDKTSIITKINKLMTCSDNYSSKEVISHLDKLISLIQSIDLKNCKIVIASDYNIVVETLYFDSPSIKDWHCFGIYKNKEVIALTKDLVLITDS